MPETNSAPKPRVSVCLAANFALIAMQVFRRWPNDLPWPAKLNSLNVKEAFHVKVGGDVR